MYVHVEAHMHTQVCSKALEPPDREDVVYIDHPPFLCNQISQFTIRQQNLMNSKRNSWQGDSLLRVGNGHIGLEMGLRILGISPLIPLLPVEGYL